MLSNSLGRSGTRVLRVFSWVSPWDWSCRPRGSKTRLRGLLLASSWLLLGSSWAPLGLLLGPLGFLLASFGLPSDAPGLVFYERFCGSRPGSCIVGLGAQKNPLFGYSWFLLASSWLLLGLSWLALGAFGLLLGSSWPPLGSSWASLRRSRTRFLRTFLWVSPWDLYFRPRGSKKPPLGLFLGSSWPPLGSSWAPLGLLLAPLGLLLGSPETLQDSLFTNVFVGLALGPVFSVSGLQKTSSWTVLGFLFASSWLLLGSSWLPLGSSWAALGHP